MRPANVLQRTAGHCWNGASGGLTCIRGARTSGLWCFRLWGEMWGGFLA